MKKLVVMLAAAVLAGCALSPPGQDEKGQELMAEATPVLHALVAYHRDRGAYPQSLHELVPKYLPRVPFGPNLNLDWKQGKVEFFYEPGFPRTDHVACLAPLGATEWSCLSYR